MRWPDWALVACALALVVVGPVMALQEALRAQQQEASRAMTGQLPAVEPGFRLAWRLPLTILLVVAGLAGLFSVARAWMEPVVRGVSGRLVALLIGGLALFAAAYWADGALFVDKPYLFRASTIVWLYPLAGILLGGSAWRLAQLQDHFGSAGRAVEFRL